MTYALSRNLVGMLLIEDVARATGAPWCPVRGQWHRLPRAWWPSHRGGLLDWQPVFDYFYPWRLL